MSSRKSFTSFEIGRAIVQTIITLTVSIWFIVAFSIYRPVTGNPDKPSCKKPIDSWLLVSGIAQLVFLVFSLIATFACRIGVKETRGVKAEAGCGTLLMTIILCLFLIFMFAWWIVGQVWTFSINKYQCNQIVYETAFWYFIVIYILMGIGVIVGIGYAIYSCCCKR